MISTLNLRYAEPGGGLGVLQPCSGGSPGVLQLVLGVGKVSCSPTLEVTQESYSSYWGGPG
ncbi:hypothetical protein GDO81_023268 [Engystomops pustulosus]|uniref:Uncharacterized protein n=1 Tax=Engystomops pustulosus TaxID=76066 RepID=A0AAV6ZDP7_ENGPU|nr:hypothetical protein GDO81_023268 [Engystomops pustulosus]